MLKKLATPDVLKTFLNSENTGSGIFSQENLDLIINSDVFKNLATPAMANIVLESKAAKNLVNKDIMKLISHPTIVNFFTADLVTKVLNADVVVNIIDPELFKWVLDQSLTKNLFTGVNLNGFMTTRAFKALVNYQFFHHLFYSDVGKAMFTPGLANGFLNNDQIAGLFSPANMGDFLKSPVALQLANPDVILSAFDTKVAKAALLPAFLHEVFYAEPFTKLFSPDLIEKVLKTDAVKVLKEKKIGKN